MTNQASLPRRTRIKICGLTREADVAAACEAGADALGFVFYPRSARAVDLARARTLCREAAPFVTLTALFVNPTFDEVRAVLDEVPVQLLQFHGDEPESFCARFGRPWLKAARVRPGLNLLDFCACHRGAQGILLDADARGYGGGGEVFDWSLIPALPGVRIVLAGGLAPHNVFDAVRRVRPWAVDVSSGVEVAKGQKDAARIAAFVRAVRAADEENHN